MLTKPFKNTRSLIKKYGAKLVLSTTTNDDLNSKSENGLKKPTNKKNTLEDGLQKLANQENFNGTGNSTQEAMVDFVITIAPLLTEEQLHLITSNLIEIDLKKCITKNSFWRNSHLSKYFAAYEIIKHKSSEKITTLPNELKKHIIKHQEKLLKKVTNGYEDIAKIFTGTMLTNAVKFTCARLKKDYEYTIQPISTLPPCIEKGKKLTYETAPSKYDDLIHLNMTGDELKECLKKHNEEDNEESYYSVPLTNTDLVSLTNTEAFKKFKASIPAIQARSTHENLLKADGIKKVVDAIEENQETGDILQIIADNQENICRNTGSGCYSFFNICCCNTDKSHSHKLLNEITHMLENPDKTITYSETTKLI